MGLLQTLTGESATLRQLTDLKDQAAKARTAYDGEAWLNLAFFLGQQWSEWHEGAIREIPRKAANEERGIPDEENLPRPVFNKIQSYIYTAQAETLQDKPSIDVLTATNDYQARSDQKIDKAYLDWIMDPVNADIDKQLSAATLWALISPSGWLKWIWDPVLKRPDVIPVPFPELYADPFAKQFGRARYAIHEMFMDPAEAEDLFEIDKIPDSEIGQQDGFKAKLMRDMGSTTPSEGIVLNEMWLKPTRKHPYGVYAIFSGSKVYKIKDRLPYEHLIRDGGRLPFTQLGSLERPDSMYYTSPATALRPAQMVWNKFIAQTIQVNDAFANPKWWIPSEIKLVALPNSSPRQILRGTGPTGVKPEIIAPPNVPDFSRLLDVFEQQMMHVVAVHEVSQGQVPGRVEAAKAIELLQSSDKGRYKHLLDTIDSSLAEGGWHWLQLAKAYESDTKMVPIFSREGSVMMKQWRKTNGDPASTTVRTVRMSGLGRTRAERESTVINLWTNGIIRDPAAAAEMMDLPRNTFTDPGAQDELLARAENVEMAGAPAGAVDPDTLKGLPVVPNQWDNHVVHLREHNEFRKTAEFRALDNENKQFFEFHCSRHYQLQLIVAQQAAQLIAASTPMQPQPGGPSPADAGGQGDPNAAPTNDTFYQGPAVGPGANPAHP